MQTYLDRTFLERGNGFHFAALPPADITDQKYLASGDPGEILACVLANLQQGRFDVAEVPIQLLRSRDQPSLWVACGHLLGYAAPMGIIRRFVDEFALRADGARQFYVCNTAMASGGTWAVPVILAAYPEMQDPDLRRFLGLALSWLLEEEPGPIWMGPDVVEDAEETTSSYSVPGLRPDLEGYVATVRAQVALLGQAASLEDRSVVAEGKALSVENVATKLLERLRRGEHSDRVEKGRMLFEAMTGIDCRPFFDQYYMLRPLAAADIVEKFLMSGKHEAYEQGVRYFFGRCIPE